MKYKIRFSNKMLYDYKISKNFLLIWVSNISFTIT